MDGPGDNALSAQTCANYTTMLGAVGNSSLTQYTHALLDVLLSVAGTPGYVDPCYQQSGQYHRYSDVYSMGTA